MDKKEDKMYRDDLIFIENSDNNYVDFDEDDFNDVFHAAQSGNPDAQSILADALFRALDKVTNSGNECVKVAQYNDVDIIDCDDTIMPFVVVNQSEYKEGDDALKITIAEDEDSDDDEDEILIEDGDDDDEEDDDEIDEDDLNEYYLKNILKKYKTIDNKNIVSI